MERLEEISDENLFWLYHEELETIDRGSSITSPDSEARHEEAYIPGNRRIWERARRDFGTRPEPEGQEDAGQLQGGDLK
jgi:hypothetical protein